MTTLHCAICGRRFGSDNDHVRVDAEHIRVGDRNDQETFVFHPECWRRLSEGWTDPA